MQLRMLIEQVRPEEKAILHRAKEIGIAVDVERWSNLQRFLGNPTYERSPILIRIPSFYRRVQVGAMIEGGGRPAYNSFWQLNTFGQKALAHLWFEAHRIPTIPSFVCWDVEAAMRSATILRYPVILKPSIGGFGRLVHWVETERELLQAFEYLEAFAPTHLATQIVQKAIDVKADVRVVLLDGRCLATMERVTSGARVRNIARGGTGRQYELSAREAELLERLSAATGAGFFGVDLLTDKDGETFICEVNAVCQFAETARVCGVDIAGELIRSLVLH